MAPQTDEKAGGGVVSGVREAVGVRFLSMLLVGALAGASVSVLGESAVAVPVVGSVSGPLLGVAGLLVAAVGYRRLGSGCGCDGDCGDSCPYES